ncbi:MAG TPA: ATP-grasp domain-containing protein, partial [Gemmatimonadales bacterium]|nr:ATP-grasp domain-containing protein [Gemmatimonadales bacterium]
MARALRARGHRVSVLGVYDDVNRLRTGLARRRPDLVFNLAEWFGDDVRGDMLVAAALDLLGYRYTGSGPGALYLSQDKALTKKLLAFDELPFPRFAVFRPDADFEAGGRLRMPLFVKPLRADASIGIGKQSLVTDAKALMRRVLAIQEEVGDAALAEEYIEGRELYVGVLGNAGNGQPLALPPVEVDFTGFPEGAPKVVGARAKWEEDTPEYKGTRSVIAELPDELRARVQKVAVEAYRALQVCDYGRVDLRLTETGELYVLEVNASCYLERGGEFAMAAAAAGIPYEELIERIVELA